jgi:hypothetical protein
MATSPTKKKPPSRDADEYSAFRQLLGDIARVPKAEVDAEDKEWREDRARIPGVRSGRKKRAS